MPAFSQSSRVFITGAGSGIGQALALAYAGPGVQLGLLGRDAGRLQATAEQIRARGAQAWRRSADVRDAAAVRVAAEDFMAWAGVPQVLIANAGISIGTLTQHPEDLTVFREIMETNWLGTVHTFGAFLPAMLAAGEGRLAGIASVAGFRGLPGAGAYSASKAATQIYLESLRLELAGTGLTVSTICPGYVDTPMTRINPYPMPWLMQPEDAAGRIRRAIDHGRPLLVLPRPMAWVGRVLRLLPVAWYDRLFRHAPRKPRRLSDGPPQREAD
ncbi:MAG: SDR family oxidoreductase [Pseudomonadota bacterium]